ncbi:MAG: 50S ribosomal protein L4 [Dehalococcoidia bacterium]
MNIDCYTTKGILTKSKAKLDDSVFAITPSEDLVHQVFISQRANLRAGTASTKNRAKVIGSTRKIRPQKGGGVARKGSIKSPLQVGGGVTFGPSPKSYAKKIPKKMNSKALKSMLSDKVASKKLLILDFDGQFTEPSTKKFISILTSLKIESSCLIVTKDHNRDFFLSARNVPKAKLISAEQLSVSDLLTTDWVILLKNTIEVIELKLRTQKSVKKESK